MHMGALATSAKTNNLVHILFNNFSHESVGGHDNSAKHVKFFKLAKILGYKNTVVCKTKKQIDLAVNKAINSKTNYFIEIICANDHRVDISRPSRNMKFLKYKFMKKISS